MKNEKLFLDIQTKCGDIASETLNAAIEAEQVFRTLLSLSLEDSFNQHNKPKNWFK